MKPFSWQLPGDLLTKSIAIMRPHGVAGNEGLALWFGTADDHSAKVTHVVEILGKGFRNHPLYMQISMAGMSSLTNLADTLDVALVGQIHSHPGLFLDLSDLDIAQGIRSPSYLSVVCPHYAQRDVRGYAECGVHTFEGGRYRRFHRNEIRDRLKTIPGDAIHVRHEVPA